MWANAQRDGRPAQHGGALCSTPQSLADAHYYMQCSNAAKTRKPLKVAAQTPETISTDRQTTDRQTTDGRATANSARSLKMKQQNINSH